MHVSETSNTIFMPTRTCAHMASHHTSQLEKNNSDLPKKTRKGQN